MSATTPQDFAVEAALMNRYCDGEAAAFSALYQRLAPRILAYLVGLIGERAAADDILQLTFLKLHEARDQYVRGANPIPWLYTIAHRTCLDELRRRKRSKVKLTTDGDLPMTREPRAALDGSSEEQAQRRQEEAMATIPLSVLEQLPENQREALILTKLHGHSHAEAAQISGTTPGAIKLRAHRAYESLRRLLGKPGGVAV
jgi:RNA polymerase sigma-70 factor (ECF subfamily)